MKPLVGVVTSTKMAKTATVEVRRVKIHPIYKKRVRTRKKYHAHDLLGVKTGDKVKIKETKPVSKTKKWQIIEKIK